jgi:cytochrome b561
MPISSTAAALPDTTGGVYDAVTIRLHWTVAILVAIQWSVGRIAIVMPRGPVRVDIWTMHVLIGFALACVIIFRVVWRLWRGQKLPAADRGLLNVIAKGTHYLLYVLLVTVVTLGIINAFAHAFPMFNVWSLPALGDRAFMLKINGWHNLMANLLVIVALIHALAALFHHYVLKDGVLGRMAPKFARRR